MQCRIWGVCHHEELCEQGCVDADLEFKELKECKHIRPERPLAHRPFANLRAKAEDKP